MKFAWILIDGYSLLYRWRSETPEVEDLPFPRQREALVRLVCETATALAYRVTVVFDGRGPRAEIESNLHAIEVVFAPAHQTADAYIERLAASQPDAARMLVVTSDRAERETTEAAGASSMSCGVFLEHCEAIRRHVARQTALGPRRGRGFDLGSAFPDDAPPPRSG